MKLADFKIRGTVDSPPGRTGVGGGGPSEPMLKVLAALGELKDGDWLHLEATGVPLPEDSNRSTVLRRTLTTRGYKVVERTIDGTVHVYIRKPPVEMVDAE